MNLQQLRYVIATAHVGTMTAAAADLHVAQPALSRAVRALETELGVTIFARHGRGLRLTAEGRDVVAIACRIVAEVERLSLLGTPGVLKVTATKGQAREVGFPAVARHMQTSSHRVQLAVVDAPDEVFNAVRQGDAHLGLTELPGPGDLDSESLGWQEIVLLHPPDWDLPSPLPIGGLADIPLLVAPPDDWRRNAVEAGLRSYGIEPCVAAETTERDLMSKLVTEGAGATFSYGRQAAEACAAGARATRLQPPPFREVGVVHSVSLAGDAAAFLELLRSEAGDVLISAEEHRRAGAGQVVGFMSAARSPAG
jgi:DNA-binding transcriptional LysR family regulator